MDTPTPEPRYFVISRGQRIELPRLMPLDLWPDCASPGCRNKCCLSLDSRYCHPHTMLRRRSQLRVVPCLVAAALVVGLSVAVGLLVSGAINWFCEP